MTGHVRVDEEGRRVAWGPSPARLWLRGSVFVVLGVGLPVVTLGGGPGSRWTIPVLLVTATAAWFVAALRDGAELDAHGVETDIGRRRPTRIAWGEIQAFGTEGDQLVATTRDGRAITVAYGDPRELRSGVTAAVELGIVPAHVRVGVEP